MRSKIKRLFCVTLCICSSFFRRGSFNYLRTLPTDYRLKSRPDRKVIEVTTRPPWRPLVSEEAGSALEG